MAAIDLSNTRINLPKNILMILDSLQSRVPVDIYNKDKKE